MGADQFSEASGFFVAPSSEGADEMTLNLAIIGERASELIVGLIESMDLIEMELGDSSYALKPIGRNGRVVKI